MKGKNILLSNTDKNNAVGSKRDLYCKSDLKRGSVFYIN